MKGELIGAGCDKRIYSDAKNPEKYVVGEFRYGLDDYQIKGLYYFGKLAHILFPKNIPEPHLAANTRDGESIFQADRTEVDEEHAAFQSFRAKYDAEFMAEKISKEMRNAIIEQGDKLDPRANDPRVLKFINDAERCGFHIDTGPQNFAIGSDGAVKYLDTNPPWRNIGEHDILPEFDHEKLKAAIDSLDGEQRVSAKRYLERIHELMDAARASRDSV